MWTSPTLRIWRRAPLLWGRLLATSPVWLALWLRLGMVQVLVPVRLGLAGLLAMRMGTPRVLWVWIVLWAAGGRGGCRLLARRPRVLPALTPWLTGTPGLLRGSVLPG